MCSVNQYQSLISHLQPSAFNEGTRNTDIGFSVMKIHLFSIRKQEYEHSVLQIEIIIQRVKIFMITNSHEVPAVVVILRIENASSSKRCTCLAGHNDLARHLLAGCIIRHIADTV